MLFPSDADIIRRDTKLGSKLRLLLDPEAFAAAINPYIKGSSIERAQATYVRYKPGVNCLVAYSLSINGKQVEAYAKAYAPSDRIKLDKARRDSYSEGGCHRRLVLDDKLVVVSFFPNDSKLKNLKLLINKETRRKVLASVSSEWANLHGSELRILRYKPERRCVTQLSVDASPVAVLKVYVDDSAPSVVKGLNRLTNRGALRLPKQIGVCERTKVAALEWVEGQLLSELITGTPANLDAVEIVGTALAELHGQRASKLAPLTRTREAKMMLARSEAIGFVLHRFRERIGYLARVIAENLLSSESISVPIHGDFYSKQVLVQSDAAAFLDFDRASTGDPAADLGNFFAHLELEAICGDVTDGNVGEVQEAFLKGYQRGSKFSAPKRLGLYTAKGLLDLAVHLFRFRDPAWFERSDAIIARAERIMTSASKCRVFITSCHSSKSKPPLTDPFGIASDPAMPFLRRVLDYRKIGPAMERLVHDAIGEKLAPVVITSINVRRYKPSRSCLIEYDVEVRRAASHERLTLIGKARARGFDPFGLELLSSLREAGFVEESADGVFVPEPFGAIPRSRIWFQRSVPGVTAASLLETRRGPTLAALLAEAIHKLHRFGVPVDRSHTASDELRKLDQLLTRASQANPQWASRINRVLEGCHRLASTLPAVTSRPIHRDFYQDQVVVDGPRIAILDLDLYCKGDPAVDAGNFIGHLIELRVRGAASAEKIARCELVFEERFVELSGKRTLKAVRAYTTLTLARHIFLSTQFDDRRHSTETIIGVCERRLGLPPGPQMPLYNKERGRVCV